MPLSAVKRRGLSNQKDESVDRRQTGGVVLELAGRCSLVTRTIGKVHVLLSMRCDELGLGLDWTRRRCVTPGENLKKRRVAKPSDHLLL
jgi:hypothetical protein